MFDLVANEPIDVPTRETVMFLASHIPPGAQILEIGCGEGFVASELFRRGYRVTGLDSDPALIARAQNRGISAVLATDRFF
jgi:2-polyprenyl-3-methyl-5-hydroxy-6-metoxy-1,4-benzoquinol methylase